MVDGFLARLLVTHAYSFASRGSTAAYATTSAPLECSLTELLVPTASAVCLMPVYYRRRAA